jgi:hypothetical protein
MFRIEHHQYMAHPHRRETSHQTSPTALIWNRDCAYAQLRHNSKILVRLFPCTKLPPTCRTAAFLFQVSLFMLCCVGLGVRLVFRECLTTAARWMGNVWLRHKGRMECIEGGLVILVVLKVLISDLDACQRLRISTQIHQVSQHAILFLVRRFPCLADLPVETL